MLCFESYQSSLTGQCRVCLAYCWNFNCMKVPSPSYTPLGDQLPVTMPLLLVKLCVPCLSWPAYPARGLVNTVTNEMTSPTWRLPSHIQHPLEKCRMCLAIVLRNMCIVLFCFLVKFHFSIVMYKFVFIEVFIEYSILKICICQ